MGHIKVGTYEPKHLSYSSLNTYRFCGKQFQLSKVLQLEERPGLASIGGNAVHTASEWVDWAEYTGRPVEEIAQEHLIEMAEKISQKST